MLLPLLLLLPPADPPPPRAVAVRLHRPQDLGARILSFFEGTKAASPAAALAGYRRARGGSSGLSKAAEAGIAAINPGMVRELGLLDGASFGLWRAPDGRPAWDLVVPRDDGTLAALATALALTDGGPDAPIDGRPVDRLGPPGAPLFSRSGEAVVVAGDRAALVDGVARASGPRPAPLPVPIAIRLDPTGIAGPGWSLPARRLGEALLGLGTGPVEATAVLTDGLHLSIATKSATAPTPGRGRIDRAWLETIPEDAAAAFALAIDPDPTAVDAAFALLDRVEKADPARLGVAPIRLRVDLIARAANVRPESDVWPHLVGLSGFASTGRDGRVDGASLRLHLDGEPAADRIVAEVIPRLVDALNLTREDLRATGKFSAFRAGGRVIRFHRRGATVEIRWTDRAEGPGMPGFPGPVGPAGPARIDTPGAPRLIGPAPGSPPPGRFAIVLPGRFVPGTPPLPPVVWRGETTAAGSTDSVRWPDLKATVATLMARLPFDPPPDASTATVPPPQP